MTTLRFAFGPLTTRLGGDDRSVCAAIGEMFQDARSSGARAVDVDVDVAVTAPQPRRWSKEFPGSYEVDRSRAAIRMQVADWTADFLLKERRTRVTFRDLWYPGIEHFFKMFVQTWLPVCGRGVAFHASAVLKDGRCLLFPARAETGKTTVARLCHERGWTVITEEMACCSVGGGAVRLHALPFRERSGLNTRERVVTALDGVYSLRQANRDWAVPVGRAEATLLLARNAAVGFREPEIMTPALEMCAEVARAVPVSVLDFAPGPGFIEVIESDATSTVGGGILGCRPPDWSERSS